MKPTARIALSSLLGALSLVCLLLTVFPLSTYVMPMLASFCLIPVVVECGRRWSTAVYTAMSLLALILVPDPEAKCLYVLFFGCYPIFKSWAEQRTRAVAWLCKLLSFNGSFVVGYTLLSLIGFSLEEFRIPGIPLPLGAFLLAYLLVGNLVFLMYDAALSKLVPLYRVLLQPVLRRMFR